MTFYSVDFYFSGQGKQTRSPLKRRYKHILTSGTKAIKVTINSPFSYDFTFYCPAPKHRSSTTNITANKSLRGGVWRPHPDTSTTARVAPGSPCKDVDLLERRTQSTYVVPSGKFLYLSITTAPPHEKTSLIPI